MSHTWKVILWYGCDFNWRYLSWTAPCESSMSFCCIITLKFIQKSPFHDTHQNSTTQAEDSFDLLTKVLWVLFDTCQLGRQATQSYGWSQIDASRPLSWSLGRNCSIDTPGTYQEPVSNCSCVCETEIRKMFGLCEKTLARVAANASHCTCLGHLCQSKRKN